eukprot:jgi/Botrbrau1/18909/Bobra.177_2s0066.1
MSLINWRATGAAATYLGSITGMTLELATLMSRSGTTSSMKYRKEEPIQATQHAYGCLRTVDPLRRLRTPIAGVTARRASPGFVDQFKAMLDSAGAEGVKVVPALWDFLAFNKQTNGVGPNPMGGQHVGLFQEEGKVNAFIDNALLPLVTGVGKHPALLAWDINQ